MKTLNKILLIDDDFISNAVTQASIRKSGVAKEIQTAMNGKDGLEIVTSCLANSAQDCPELILLDINMPVMDGFEFLQKFDAIQAVAKPTIVMFTSSDDARDKEKAFKFKEVVGFITKPFELRKIESILDKLP